jgi:hypothetical protein
MGFGQIAHSPRTPPSARTGLIVASLVILVLGGVTLFLLDRYAEPTVNIPPRPATPSPNAYDVFVKAADAMVREKEVDEVFMLRTADRTTPAKRAELVAANSEALEMARRGLRLPYLDPTPVGSFDVAFDDYARFRALARPLVLEGRVHLERGDRGAALDSYLDVAELGRRIRTVRL